MAETSLHGRIHGESSEALLTLRGADGTQADTSSPTYGKTATNRAGNLLNSRAVQAPSAPMNLDNIRIVLVNTTHPGNIGGVARAMKNMGLSRLYLVAPEKFPDEQAVWRAASAGDLLDSAVVTATVEEAIADCQFVVGTSARERRIPWPLLDPRQCAARIDPLSQREQVAIMFGREDRGLTNEELQLCNLHLNIPTSDAYSSLNLAMAVQIVCYELRMLLVQPGLPETEDAQWDTPFCYG